MRFLCSFFLLAATLATSAAMAVAPALNSNPAEWSSEDVYQILNKSPWTGTVKAKLATGDSGAFGNQGANAGANGDSTRQQMSAGMGGAGRRGGGMGRSGGTYSSGGASSAGSGPAKSGPTEVKVQWQSALVVRMAAAKKSGGSVDASSLKPLDEYVIAVIGLPVTAVGGRAASADSDNTLSSEQERRIEENVRSSASILRSGHDPITPTKVQLDQGSDGRMLIHFPKSNPITANEKTAEFRIAAGKTEVRKKFVLKDMEFGGKLDL